MTDPLFVPLDMPGGLRLRNRIVMAPMTTYSADPDGSMSAGELDYYRARAAGAGMVLTGCTHVSANGVGFIEEFAGFDDQHIPSLTRLAHAAKSGGAAAVLQIFHAGDKAMPDRVPGGDLVSASAHTAPPSQQNPGGAPVRALTEAEIHDIIHDFGQTTRRAIEAGFDGIELHGAHGFLLQQFLSPASNTRTDQWGGSPENRERFARAVAHEVHQVAGEFSDRPFVIGYRISLEETSMPDGLRLPDTLALVEHLIADGSIDYVHASLRDAVTDTPATTADTPAVDGGTTLLHELVHTVDHRILVFAAGGFLTPTQARAGLQTGLDAVVVGRGLVINPHWVQLAHAGHDDQITTAIDPADPSFGGPIPDGLRHMIATYKGWFPTLIAR